MNKKQNLNRLNNVRIPQKKSGKKYCRACKYGLHYFDYKEVGFLSSFLNPQGRILPPRYTGNCHRHQPRIASAIKKARVMAYLPYVTDHFFSKS